MWDALRTFEGLDSLSVRVIVHGFGSSCPHVWIYELRTALMAVVSNDVFFYPSNSNQTYLFFRKTALLFVWTGNWEPIYPTMSEQPPILV